MIRRSLARVARMDAAEITWRVAAAARIMGDRARTRLVTPKWSRRDLLSALAPVPELTAARAALANGDWPGAHRELSRHVAELPQRFAISPGSRPALVERVRREFPDAARDATTRADKITSGEYDVLGYEGLRFDGEPDRSVAHHASASQSVSVRSGLPDWHFDPVHRRSAPRTFWATVPYLDPKCGDHKIIWEPNRHQHWLALGRAFWLTDDRRYRDRFLAELSSWLADNPPLVGINWASMLELAFRSLSWMWAINFFVEQPAEAAHSSSERDASPWLVDLLLALDRQLTHVERNLSQYFSPNTHLLGEALALYVSGCALPALAASSRRAATGRRILLAEIERQILPDGGHCERCTHYHRYVLDFYALALLVARQSGDPAALRFEDAVIRLAQAARLLADDNGRVPHIGDDDGGMLFPITARPPDDLRGSLAIAAALLDRPDLQIEERSEETLWMLGPGVAWSDRPFTRAPVASGALPETGYYVSRSPGGHHLVIDGGPHGYQNAGHAHADALALTFTLKGIPLLIDPGAACYTVDTAMRDRMRSTPLHNTLTLDDRSQSIPSGPFHWSHVANGRAHRWRTHEAFDYFDGSHDGYRSIEHRRRVLALHGDLVVVADLVDGAGLHAAAVHWHLDPRWSVDTRAGGATFIHPRDPAARAGLSVPNGVVTAFAGDADTGLGWRSPAYGQLERATTVRISHAGAVPFWMVSVFDMDDDNPVADVTWVPIFAEAGAISHAIAIRIARAASVDHVLFAEAAPLAVAQRPRLRVGDVETDARMLFYRSIALHSVTRLAMVDGSVVRATGGRDFEAVLPAIAPVFFFDSTQDQQSRTQDPCVALPVS